MSITELYSPRSHVLWQAFKSEIFSFWMAFTYLIFEYVWHKSIWPILNFYPYWGGTFVVLVLLGWRVFANRQFVWTKLTTGVFTLLFIITFSSYTAYWPQALWEKYMDYIIWVVIFFVLTQVVTTRQQFFIYRIKENIRPWLVKLHYLIPITAAFTIMGENTRGGTACISCADSCRLDVNRLRPAASS